MRYLLCYFCLLLLTVAHAQKTWDAGAGTQNWDHAANWHPDGVPVLTDKVILDHTFLSDTFTVVISDTARLSMMHFKPGSKAISLVLSGSKPFLEIQDSLLLDSNAVLINASQAASGAAIAFNSSGRVFILRNGSCYIHRSPRSHSNMIQALSSLPGTEKGLFRFDVPGSIAYAISMSGHTYGSLQVSGQSRTYSGNASSDLTINGDLIIDSTITFIPGIKAYIRLKGDLHIAGSFSWSPQFDTMPGRKLVMEGTTRQYISGQGNFSPGAFFEGMMVQNPKGVALKRNFLFQDSLFLKQGCLYTDSSHLLTLDTNAYISGNSNSSAIQGPVILRCSDTLSHFLPLAWDSLYRPVSIKLRLPAYRSFYIHYLALTPPYRQQKDTGLQAISKKEYWNIQCLGANSIALLGLQWGSLSGIGSPADLVMAHCTDTAWHMVSSYTNSPMLYVDSADLSGYYTFGSTSVNNPLPVTWLNITIDLRQPHISWSTASEINSDHFEIERSADGLLFTSLSHIAAAGNSTSVKHYSWTDPQPLPTKVYYRIKQVDTDGRPDYSLILCYIPQPQSHWSCYPVPAQNTLTVAFPQVMDKALCRVYDLYGRLILAQSVTAGDPQLDISLLPAGKYILRIEWASGQENLFWVKEK